MTIFGIYCLIFQLISQIVGFLLWAAGFIYLLENQGDPFHHYENARPAGEFRYVDAIWFLLITASTVGYGDFFPVTDLGKIFGIFYLARKPYFFSMCKLELLFLQLVCLPLQVCCLKLRSCLETGPSMGELIRYAYNIYLCINVCRSHRIINLM